MLGNRFKQRRRVSLFDKEEKTDKQSRLLRCNGFTPLQLSGLRLGQKNMKSIDLDIKLIQLDNYIDFKKGEKK